jgi:hypothetical protein
MAARTSSRVAARSSGTRRGLFSSPDSSAAGRDHQPAPIYARSRTPPDNSPAVSAAAGNPALEK